MKKYLLWVFTCLLLLSFSAGASFAEMKGIMLSPLRVVLEDGKNYATVTVLNQSPNEPVIYSVRTRLLRMNENGDMKKPLKTTKREALAQAMVRFSPKKASLKPGGKQIVRIAVRRPPNLPDGEYYTYMNVTPTAKEEIKSGQTGGETVGMSVDMLVGVSIPIIIKQGNISSSAKILSVEPEIIDKMKSFKVKIARTGKASSYVGIYIFGKVNGEEKVIAAAKRVVTLVPLKERFKNIPLYEKDFKGGPIRVELREFQERGTEPKIIEVYEYNI